MTDSKPTDTLEKATEAAKAETPSTLMAKVASSVKSDKEKLEEAAMYGFQQGYPAFVKKLEEISSRSLRRAWAAAVAGPLMEKEPHFSYQEEKEAYAMAVKLDEYKFSMILLGIDKYMLHGKEKPSATVSSVPSDATPGDGQPSETKPGSQEETSVSNNEQPGESSANSGTI